MRAVLKEGPGPGCRLVGDRDEPALRDGEVRVAVAFASVCGTDAAFHASGDAGGDLSMTYPRTMGHEVSGTVVELGPGAPTGPDGDPLRAGARVTVETHIHGGSCWFCLAGHGHDCARMRILGIDVDGTFAERLVVPASTCCPVPDTIRPAAATMLESAGSAVHGLLRSGVPLPGAAVLVTGAGAVGLAAAQVAAALGARQVVVVEPTPARRDTAAALGAEAAADADVARELMDHDARLRGGFDLAVECSGALPALQAAVRSVRREATVVAVGLVKAELPLSVTGTARRTAPAVLRHPRRDREPVGRRGVGCARRRRPRPPAPLPPVGPAPGRRTGPGRTAPATDSPAGLTSVGIRRTGGHHQAGTAPDTREHP